MGGGKAVGLSDSRGVSDTVGRGSQLSPSSGVYRPGGEGEPGKWEESEGVLEAT